jgi:hypothetical protein
MNWRDDYIAYYMPDDMEERYYEKLRDLKRGLWRTKNEGEVKLKDMSDSHLNNCLKRFEEDEDMAKYFKKEINRRIEEKDRKAKEIAIENRIKNLEDKIDIILTALKKEIW